jgi:rubredoxin
MSPLLHQLAATAVCLFSISSEAFAPPSYNRVAPSLPAASRRHYSSFQILRLSESDDESTSSPAATTTTTAVVDEPPMDAATKLALEKQRKADELRAQEVFMKRSTGLHKCSNCDWEYNPEKGDSFLIGGMIKPGTEFVDLPSNWRCPTCRASKDSFVEVVETIPGFEVNQGYGFGTNSMTSGQKNTLIWGSMAAFVLLFLGGYALS